MGQSLLKIWKPRWNTYLFRGLVMEGGILLTFHLVAGASESARLVCAPQEAGGWECWDGMKDVAKCWARHSHKWMSRVPSHWPPTHEHNAVAKCWGVSDSTTLPFLWLCTVCNPLIAHNLLCIKPVKIRIYKARWTTGHKLWHSRATKMHTLALFGG